MKWAVVVIAMLAVICSHLRLTAAQNNSTVAQDTTTAAQTNTTSIDSISPSSVMITSSLNITSLLNPSDMDMNIAVLVLVVSSRVCQVPQMKVMMVPV